MQNEKCQNAGPEQADAVGRPRKMADGAVLDKTTRFHFHAHITQIVRIATTVGSRGLKKQWPRPLLPSLTFAGTGTVLHDLCCTRT